MEQRHMAKLALNGLTKRFGDLEVLRDISVTINDGEFVALVGPSGCGKTTFLRIVSGLEAAEGGTVSVDDAIVTGAPSDFGGDFNGDGRSDILWRRDSDGQTVVWEMDGSQKLLDVNLNAIPTAWQVQGVGDFNGDGKSDILCATAAATPRSGS